jgi:hypothetical protein
MAGKIKPKNRHKLVQSREKNKNQNTARGCSLLCSAKLLCKACLMHGTEIATHLNLQGRKKTNNKEQQKKKH